MHNYQIAQRINKSEQANTLAIVYRKILYEFYATILLSNIFAFCSAGTVR